MTLSIHETVITSLQRLLEVDAPPTPEMHLHEELQVSSMTMVALITELCETLNVSILDFGEQDLIGLRHVSDIIGLFELKRTVTVSA